MRTGIIGAGKVGCSLGKYFRLNDLEVTGYYDVNENLAKEAADFTATAFIKDLDTIVKESDTLFLTVPDDLITIVWNQIKDMPLEGRFICHCSGALSAEDAFPGIKDRGAFGYSVHPLFAVSDKFHSYEELPHAFFTIEGDEEHLNDITALFQSFGNPVRNIKAKDKVKYHCAAAICSNQVIALIQESLDLLSECGFDEESALSALAPIITGNVAHIVKDGTAGSLTGPVERGDTDTVKKHLNCLNEEDRLLYRLLSRKLLSVGKKKNPQRDYSRLESLLHL